MRIPDRRTVSGGWARRWVINTWCCLHHVDTVLALLAKHLKSVAALLPTPTAMRLVATAILLAIFRGWEDHVGFGCLTPHIQIM
jgi:hypothetical protein